MTAATASGARPGEFELIERYFAPLSAEGSFGLADDAAMIRVTPGKALAVTQDAIAAGVHFFPDDPPDTIARKALRTNLSDLAAKGATPAGFSLALGLHPEWDEAWVASFASGLAADCRTYAIPLTGGDTFRAPGGPVISITAWGEVEPSGYRSRLDARPGDRLFVTGTIGDAALGLKVRQGDPQYAALAGASDLLSRYLVPEPPVSFAPLIARHASASMDISDGLAGDLAKLARASRVDFDLPVAKVPLSSAAAWALRLDGAWAAILSGGDDYQLLFTVPQAGIDAFLEEVSAQPVPVTELATASSGDGAVRVVGPDGSAARLDRLSFQHF